MRWVCVASGAAGKAPALLVLQSGRLQERPGAPGGGKGCGSTAARVPSIRGGRWAGPPALSLTSVSQHCVIPLAAERGSGGFAYRGWGRVDQPGGAGGSSC